MYWQFIAGFLIYTLIALLSYHPLAKISPWAYPLVMMFGMAANAVWLHIARMTTDPSRLAMTGLYWDIMLTGIYLVVPIVMFGARFSLMQGSGVAVIIAGIVMTKL